MSETMSANEKYEHYAGFITNLTDKFADVDSDLPIHEQHLAQLKNRITDGKYTFLKILDGTHTEYIKVSNRGGALFVGRGFELTAPKTFPIGSCVKWELTPTAVRDIICQMECC